MTVQSVMKLDQLTFRLNLEEGLGAKIATLGRIELWEWVPNAVLYLTHFFWLAKDHYSLEYNP